MTDGSNSLNRFVEAQNPVYENVIRELTNGRKLTHWMWYIFPQIAGLGSSPTAIFYAIQSADVARAYLAHPILGERLLECTNLAMAHDDKSAREIFGNIDAIKFRSSMTLFASFASSDSVYQQVINIFFSGIPDPKTLEILASG